MFIHNAKAFPNTELYYCGEDEANSLQRKGFALFSIVDDKYTFVMTPKLKAYLQKEGGEICDV